MNSASRDAVVKLIDRALAGKLSLAEVTPLCPTGNEARELQEAWHAVIHFVTDEDIRSRDPDYDRNARADLSEMKRALLAL